ncbi:MAG: hypothetical protein JF887_06650 [Candidatus Dormibacteraeota bacterium]|uniref:Uncharacterized protein n=1 Tax=Candidatus Amunia macphersoniae TaxID=3127014 RepID=A0A934NGA9_9BACT|nr:hypothetical protein [Candidatus Dormibacteraeota bacterium]
MAPLRPVRLWSPLIIIVGGAAAAVINVGNDNGALTLVGIGLALVAGGVASPRHRWMLPMGLPFLAVGCSVRAAGLVPFLQAHLTVTVFIALGASVMAADRLAAPGRAWAASLAVLAMAAGFIIVALGPPNSGVVIPGWTFGASLAVLGLVVGADAKLRLWPHPGISVAQTIVDETPSPRVTFARGALLFAGGVGASVVDGWGHNLYQVVAALGVAYLVPGVITRQRRWAESGLLLTALGAVIVSTDFLPATATYIYGLVFAAIAAAMLLLQGFSLGRIRGIGRSLIGVSAFLFVLSVLPNASPLAPIGRNIDAIIPLLPAASGLTLLVRAWRGATSER